MAAKPSISNAWMYRTSAPMPFRNKPRVTTTKYRAGTSSVTPWSGGGITSIAYMNPESRNAGRNVTTMASWVASSCDFVAAEMNMPRPSEPVRNSAERTMSWATLPRNGTSNRKTPSADVTATSISPIAR